MTSQTSQTIGQRIAACRREAGLSQEALGGQLGVSRQAIYKWETDAALPEIEKLIALSRLFGISVGELLGVEEPEVQQEAAASQGELSEQQLKMVEEIVSRYLAAQPRPQRKRWPWVLAACAAVAVLAGGIRICDSLETIQNNYNSMAGSVNNISNSVSSQIDAISSRVEEILQQQNSMLADYEVSVSNMDYRENRVCFHASVVPKTWAEGLRVIFTVESQGVPQEVEGTWSEGNRYSAELICALTDEIAVSVSFEQDGVRQTQQLQTWDWLYTSSFPGGVSLCSTAFTWPEEQSVRAAEEGENCDAVLTLTEHDACLYIRRVSETAKVSGVTEGAQSPPEVERVQVGLFVNGKLTRWLEPCDKPASYHGFEECDFYRLEERSIPLFQGDVVTFNAVITDTYGRKQVEPSYDTAVLVKTQSGKWEIQRASNVNEVWEY